MVGDKTMGMRLSIVGTFLILCCATLAHTVEAAETPAQLIGHLADMNVSYSVEQSSPEILIVEVLLPSGKSIRAEIHSGTQTVSVRSLAQRDGVVAPLSSLDHDVLRRLALPADPPAAKSALVEALARTLSFVSSYPPGEVLDYSSLDRPRTSEPKRISSLCGRTGKTATGTFTVNGSTFNQTVQVGPCYNAQNECLGRCGPGCGAPPSATIQIFTQDCLNHDLCTGATGTILGQCKDEWLAAADDFFFGADCGSLAASWTDNYQFRWQLQQIAAGAVVRGVVHSVHCSDWSVSGRHSAANVTLTAKPRHRQAGCCSAFTYVGSFQDCNSAAGSWTNPCGLSGQWTMTRDGSKSLLFFTGEDSVAPDADTADTPQSTDPP